MIDFMDLMYHMSDNNVFFSGNFLFSCRRELVGLRICIHRMRLFGCGNTEGGD